MFTDRFIFMQNSADAIYRVLRMSHLYCYAFENIDDWQLKFASWAQKMDTTCTSDTEEMHSDE